MSLEELDNSFETINDKITGEKVAKIYTRKAKKAYDVKSSIFIKKRILLNT